MKFFPPTLPLIHSYHCVVSANVTVTLFYLTEKEKTTLTHTTSGAMLEGKTLHSFQCSQNMWLRLQHL